MTFFSDFAALGYSAIVLLITFLFVGAMIFNGLGMARRPLWMRAALVVVLIALFVPATSYLAGQNRMLNDAIRAEGGLKRIDTPKPVD